MKFYVVSFLFVFSSFLKAQFPTVCDDLYQSYKSPKSKVDYRLNAEKFSRCLKALEGGIFFKNHTLKMKKMPSTDGFDFYRLDFVPKSQVIQNRILITSGIHGNEAVGPVAALEFFKDFLSEDRYGKTSFTFIPTLNPWGLKNCRRNNKDNKNLNRELHKGSQYPLYKNLIAELSKESFDLGLDCHEAFKKSGFFVIANDKADINFAKTALSSFEGKYLVQSPGNKYPYAYKAYEFFAPGVAMSKNLGTVKAFMKYDLKIPFAFTLEATGRYPLAERTKVYRSLIKAVVDQNFPRSRL